MDKGKEIIRFGEWFLGNLGDKCVQNCGKSLPAIQFPVFKKFLSYRIKREVQFYKACLDMAEAVIGAGTGISDSEIEEIIEDSIDLDTRFRRDITLLPLRVEYAYDTILPLRRERARLQLTLFMRLLRSPQRGAYGELAKGAFTLEEFLNLHNELLELYAEEAFLINLSMKSIIHINAEEIAHRMHCSMLDIGIRINRELAWKIFSSQSGAR